MSSSGSSFAAGSKKPKPSYASPSTSKWRTGVQQRVYGRRLLEALRSARGDCSKNQPKAGPRAIKDAADSALALTARGQTRWSRAILFGGCRRRKLLLKAGGKIRRPRPQRSSTKVVPDPPASMKGKKIKDRLRVLSRLIPGCRNLSAPSLLDEVADYVAALEMQAKTMRALAAALSTATLSAPPMISGGYAADATTGTGDETWES
ncbi:hypothetical protein HPP92_005294 [Vanilla planifolia]|uniref:IBH1-like N-terminal domain-containing protein n=1 Tax=Vanilla planifolia TaxID=51239 RepID=A0A835RN88_VANPL|nr:hypothetical protein HPP92_005294 [Vanilla planifolia]